jgi:hypothetical protein
VDRSERVVQQSAIAGKFRIYDRRFATYLRPRPLYSAQHAVDAASCEVWMVAPAENAWWMFCCIIVSCQLRQFRLMSLPIALSRCMILVEGQIIVLVLTQYIDNSRRSGVARHTIDQVQTLGCSLEGLRRRTPLGLWLSFWRRVDGWGLVPGHAVRAEATTVAPLVVNF